MGLIMVEPCDHHMTCLLLAAVSGLSPSRCSRLDSFRGRLRSVASSMVGAGMSNQQAVSDISGVDSNLSKLKEDSVQGLSKKGI